MDSFYEGNLSEGKKALRNKLLDVLRNCDLPCSESWSVLSYLSDELNFAGRRFSSLFTVNEILTRYEQKLAEKTE